jgi:tetratricopeptide (TPR) repeat protein
MTIRLTQLRSLCSSKLRCWLLGGVLALGVIAACLVLGLWPGSETTAGRLLRQARRTAWDGNHHAGLELAEQALQAAPDSDEARLFAAETAVRLRRPLEALEHCRHVRSGRSETSAARRIAGEIQLQLGRPLAAEGSFREALQADFTDRAARLKLMFLLRIEGRNRELAEHVCELLRTGSCPAEFLFATAWPDRIWIDADDLPFVRLCRQESPSDAIAGMGAAIQSALTPESLDAAVRLLREAASGPVVPEEVHARLGTLLVEAGRWDDFAAWSDALPPGAEAHPQVWYLRGLSALQTGNADQALHCFCDTLQRAPHHAGAIHQLTGLLAGTAQAEAVPLLMETSRQLNELRERVVVGKGRGGNPDAEVIEQIAALLETLGRDWESFGWSQLALERHGSAAGTEERLRRLKPRLVSAHPLITSVGDMTQRRDWRAISSLKLSPSVGASPREEILVAVRSHCRFAEVGSELGLMFRFHQRSGLSAPAGYMFEISAGGIGVLDFDLDGWPDVYLSQGCDWPPIGRDDTPLDQLFRNVGGTMFVSVTQASAIREADYGQGVAAGDINNDGFPDLFVANIGSNRLWINQGDGTFIDAPGTKDLAGKVWSMSAAIADFNADGVPDIFVVNYLGGDSLTKVCEREGFPVQCRPTMFPGEQNRLFVGDGQGGFTDATRESAVVFPDGKGMGVVAADFDGSGKLSLFVSNDTTQNALFKNITPHAGGPPLFEERGALAGIGFGDNGQPQASMGIALDDANCDGRLDLLVTNFTGQASNLFIQQEAGGFADLARPWRIYDKSFHRMGWGTQFLDADLDGDPDLIVANGHLEDYSRFGVVSQMSSQFFHNISGQRFEELPGTKVGPYFAEQNFGRTVARWDWNRDGREEAVVTHVDRAVALLRNETPDAGHRVSIRLVATTTARDAIGTRVTVIGTQRSLTRQLVAGDGFQCSNQRQLVIGLGVHSTDVKLRVLWPSGREQIFSDIPVDSEVLLIEGRAEWLVSASVND